MHFAACLTYLIILDLIILIFGENHKLSGPHYKVFSSQLLFRPSYVQMISSAPLSQTSDVLPFFYFYLFFYLCDGTLGTAATTGLLYQPWMIGEGDCGEIGGMRIGKGNRSTLRKPVPAPLCPPQIPHDWTQVSTQAITVGSQQLTA
jgi:hypothetical protein